MERRKMSLVFESGIEGLTERNDSFDSGILKVCYTGKNKNGSSISKDTFERCIDSIYNCPIVCHYDRDSDTIGAHDMELVSDDGGMRIVNVTQPVGVVPESAKWWWQDYDDDGETHEYLCVEVLLWKRQEAYRKIKEDGVTDESMEITIEESEVDDDGTLVISRFEFTAFCLLGTAAPCYEGASLEMFALEGFKRQFAEMMHEVKQFAMMRQPAGAAINMQVHLEGGKVLGKKDEAKAGREYSLQRVVRDELEDKLTEEKIKDYWGDDVPHYRLYDYDPDVAEVYAIDATDYKLYGFKYSMNGDSAIIDFASKKRMKYAVLPFDEGAQGEEPVPAMFDRMVESCRKMDGQWAEKYQSASDKIASLQGEVESLRRFKADAEKAAAENERAQIFARFKDLDGVEAFENLRADCGKYSTEDLEEKCYAIRGRNGSPARFSLESRGSTRLPVEPSGVRTDDEPYGGVFAEYGIRAYNQHN